MPTSSPLVKVLAPGLWKWGRKTASKEYRDQEIGPFFPVSSNIAERSPCPIRCSVSSAVAEIRDEDQPASDAVKLLDTFFHLDGAEDVLRPPRIARNSEEAHQRCPSLRPLIAQ